MFLLQSGSKKYTKKSYKSAAVQQKIKNKYASGIHPARKSLTNKLRTPG